MAKNKLADLRDHLYETIERLKEASPDEMDREVKRAKSIVEVAGAITDIAKTEVSMVAAIGGGTVKGGFFEVEALEEPRQLPKRLVGAGPELARRVAGASGGSEA